MSFYQEWDFYYIAQTDYNPKWYNYYEKGTIAHDEACVSGSGQQCDTNCETDWCKGDGPWYKPCKGCSGSGWSYLASKKKCWRHRCETNCGCGTRYLYKPTGLCYSNRSACKAEMIYHKDDYHCNSSWDLRDKNLYTIMDDDTNDEGFHACHCVGLCLYGAIKASTYDPGVFAPLGGVGPDKLVKSVVLDKKNMLNVNVFVCTLQLSMITDWSVKDMIQKTFSTGDNVYDPFTYNNFIGYIMIDCYMRMNLNDPTTGKSLTNLDSLAYFPVFLVLTENDTSAFRDPYTASGSRDIAHDFYTGKITRTYKQDCPNCSKKVKDFTAKTKALSQDYAKLDGISPTGDVDYTASSYKNNDSTFVVKPIMYDTFLKGGPDDAVDDVNMRVRKSTDPIIYMVFYSMSQLMNSVSQIGIDPITPFKDKYINNTNLNLAPECLAWNKFVYYNYILPKLCFQNEVIDKETNCPEIYNYDTNSYELSKAGCSLIASKRFPDCKKYLITDIDLEQPAVNPTRTEISLDSMKQTFCNTGMNSKLNECQCYDRANRTNYKQFTNTNYSFPEELSGAAGCWYTPCVDTKTSGIMIPSIFTAENRNCPSTICESVITIINRPENTAKVSNLNASNSCSFLSSLRPVSAKPTSTKPTSTKTISPTPVSTTPAPTPEYEYQAVEPDKIVVGSTTTTTYSNSDTGKLGLSVLIILICIVVVLILLLFSYLPAKKKRNTH